MNFRLIFFYSTRDEYEDDVENILCEVIYVEGR